jgi:hypothetical protein
MGDVTSGITIYDSTLSSGVKELVIKTGSVDSADTFTVDLSAYGMADDGLLSIFGVQHSTSNSVVTTEAPTTSVSSGTLTVTVGGSSNDGKMRVYVIRGSC